MNSLKIVIVQVLIEHLEVGHISLLPDSNAAIVLGIQCTSCTDRTNQTAGTKTGSKNPGCQRCRCK